MDKMNACCPLNIPPYGNLMLCPRDRCHLARDSFSPGYLWQARIYLKFYPASWLRQLLFGCAAQYTIMPLLGAAISKALGLSANLSAGIILLGCCPGGIASNVVTYIARGDVPLSVVMTICTTFAAVFATPILTQLLAGAYVPVDAAGLAISTLQVVLAPVVLGACMQSAFPKVVAKIILFSPLTAVSISSLLSSSVFSENVGLLGSIAEQSALLSTSTPALLLVAQAVLLLHAGGFLLGYFVSVVVRLEVAQRRAVSIEALGGAQTTD
ncbi:hypothetical protein GOP47_0004488 [Adiantum capillus-veneris]|uniref:Uncharacterized protein n=1 Tax=Adiantum capillus-veneris TaxID=13818 RepID=A0A9D4V8C2_ADICA|nr:hypothetical protein GOP47_0004488 [Adiantum capillus-veneris]